jgi:formylmethanofuran dehydrogenase subunit B
VSLADHFLELEPARDLQALLLLRALVKGISVSSDDAITEGLSVPAWTDLAQRMKRCRYGALFLGIDFLRPRLSQWAVESVLRFVRDLNATTPFCLLPMGEPRNVIGAQNVLTAETGYPFAVDLGPGGPRFGPGEFTAERLLSTGETDAALVIAADPFSSLSGSAQNHLRQVTSVVLNSEATAIFAGAAVAFLTARDGIEAGGTIYRSDGVSLPLRRLVSSSLPTTCEILSGLDQRLLGLGAKAAMT